MQGNGFGEFDADCGQSIVIQPEAKTETYIGFASDGLNFPRDRQYWRPRSTYTCF